MSIDNSEWLSEAVREWASNGCRCQIVRGTDGWYHGTIDGVDWEWIGGWAPNHEIGEIERQMKVVVAMGTDDAVAENCCFLCQNYRPTIADVCPSCNRRFTP